MEIRTTKPINNKFYITTSKGGYSTCIQGKPTDKSCNVLANCVGYACGRFNEIIGSMKYPSLNCNAENFIERAKSLGLTIANYPTLGGIMVWQKGNTLNSNDGAGHVAIVERIDGPDAIYTSESSYGGAAFYNAIRKNTNGRWGMSGSYSFRGCIINPSIGDVHYEEPTPEPTKELKYKVGDTVTINGVYTNSNADEKKVPAIKTGRITKIVEGAKNPYLLENGNIGWINDNCIVSSSKVTVDNSIKVGDTVRVKQGAKSYKGVALASFVFNNTYEVMELNGDRAVIGKNGAVTTDIHIDNLYK